MSVSTIKLQQVISEILEGANLDEVTQKGVRKQVEEKLGVDLTDRKKEVDKLIMDTLNEKRNGSEEEEEEEESEEEKKPAKRGRKPKASAKNGGSESGSDDDSEPRTKKTKKAPAKKATGGGGRKPGTGYTKECKLSPELAAVMGQPSMARHEVVKQMWKIVKEKNLYDPKNKQFAICNAELLPVFGVKRFRTFGMMKYLKNHFVD